eukprot:CAMPEP_0178488728 /NCGR_PEP_ID=MMETSP0696-20121128/10010_1 /TAXON_ID=265572 /ORGANISM="Extubocellulus spinifer, Strain CCMP396" /LENGTH=90 /DNA_ID=CAMNT_0020116507 /DNA_START=594 /DNA_END=867 /DNA_ORIENTATION=-
MTLHWLADHGTGTTTSAYRTTGSGRTDKRAGEDTSIPMPHAPAPEKRPTCTCCRPRATTVGVTRLMADGMNVQVLSMAPSSHDSQGRYAV